MAAVPVSSFSVDNAALHIQTKSVSLSVFLVGDDE